MKNIKGLFHEIAESLMPGISSPDKIIRENVIYKSFENKINQSKDVIKGAGIGRGLDIEDNISKEKRKVLADTAEKKAKDIFAQSSFEKGAMDVDPKGLFTKMKDIDINIESIGDGKNPGDLFDIDK